MVFKKLLSYNKLMKSLLDCEILGEILSGQEIGLIKVRIGLLSLSSSSILKTVKMELFGWVLSIFVITFLEFRFAVSEILIVIQALSQAMRRDIILLFEWLLNENHTSTFQWFKKINNALEDMKIMSTQMFDWYLQK